jgi:hypothetical protein
MVASAIWQDARAAGPTLWLARYSHIAFIDCVLPSTFSQHCHLTWSLLSTEMPGLFGINLDRSVNHIGSCCVGNLRAHRIKSQTRCQFAATAMSATKTHVFNNPCSRAGRLKAFEPQERLVVLARLGFKRKLKAVPRAASPALSGRGRGFRAWRKLLNLTHATRRQQPHRERSGCPPSASRRGMEHERVPLCRRPA